MKPTDAHKAALKYEAGLLNPRRRWEDSWEPYRAALARLKLPKRGKRGSKANYRRQQLVCLTMRAVKERGTREHSTTNLQ